MRRLPARLALSLAFSLSPLALAASTDPVLIQAEKLIADRQAAAAYALLAPLEDQRAGDPDFDYVLGLAALESGQGSVAAFAFERCLAVDPKNGPCRVLMARTHLALGESSSARQELQTVEASEPPPEVRELVARYLGAVAQRERQDKRRLSAYAQLGAGYDSNVSSTTEQTQIAIPALGGLPFTLNGTATQAEDTLLQAAAGASLEYALTPAWTLLADAGLATRRHDDVDTFDSLSGDLGLGIAWRAGPGSVLARLQGQDYRLDDERFRSVYGLMTQYQHTLGEDTAVSVYVQASRLDYRIGMPDADRYTLGTGYSRAFSAGGLTPVMYLGLYGGKEESDVGSAGLGQDFYGLRLGGSLGLSAALGLTASLSVEEREFDGRQPLFGVVREDTAVDFNLGAIVQLAPRLSLRPAYTFSRSDSNIVLNDFDRHVVTVDVRYEL